MAWHEIVKYNPVNYDKKGVYTIDEWTSRCDVGKHYNGKLFTIEYYLDVEQRYIAVILAITKATKCKRLTIQYLEADKDYIVSRIESSNFYEIDSHLLSSIPLLEVGRQIGINQLSDILRLALREYIYVELSNKEHDLQIKFGYDYYLNVACSLNNEVLSNIVRNEGLFLDPRF